MAYQIEYAYTCHMGRVRANNEDNFWCCGEKLEAENQRKPWRFYKSYIPVPIAAFGGV